MALVEQLGRSYLAQGLTSDELSGLAAQAVEISYADGDAIIREGDAAGVLYVVVAGKVQVQTFNGDLIARLGEGAVIGEVALFEASARTASVVADGNCTVARFDAPVMEAWMDAHPATGVKVLRNLGRTLCQRLRSSNIQLEAVLNAI